MLVSLVASFSPLSSNIYFPALDLIADTLGTDNSTFATSVSIYMYVQRGFPFILLRDWVGKTTCLRLVQDCAGTCTVFVGTACRCFRSPPNPDLYYAALYRRLRWYCTFEQLPGAHAVSFPASRWQLLHNFHWSANLTPPYPFPRSPMILTVSKLTGAGIIADIAPPAERGGFIGKFSGGLSPLTLPSLRHHTAKSADSAI